MSQPQSTDWLYERRVTAEMRAGGAISHSALALDTIAHDHADLPSASR